MSEVLDAAFNLVHDHPGGAASLAPRVAKNPATLCHEVTAAGTAKLGLETAVKLSVLTQDQRILNAFAAACGCLVFPMPAVQPGGADAMHRVASLANEFGDVVRVVADAAADGRISANELAKVEREWGDLVACGQALVAHLRGVHEAQQLRRAGGVA